VPKNGACRILQDTGSAATVRRASNNTHYHYGQRQQRSQKGSQKAEEGKAQAGSCGTQELGQADPLAVDEALLGFMMNEVSLPHWQ